MKITIYELLGMVKDEHDRSIYVKYFDRVNKKEEVMWACKENIIYKLEQLVIELNDEVEILEEEKKIPEKITINDNGTIGFPNGQWTARNMDKAFAIKINSIIDYLKSKGDE